MEEQDYYEILQVSPNADAEVIESAFRRLARKYHPDVNKDPDAGERMKRIVAAYEVLKDPQKRARYDLYEFRRVKAQRYKADYEGASAYFEQEREKEIERLSQVIALNPNNAEAYHTRGDLYLINRYYQRAIQDFDQALALKPDFLNALVSRAGAFEAVGLYQRAIQDYDRAISLNPDEPEQLFHSRGMAYARLGQYEQALRDLDQALTLDADFSWAIYSKAQVYSLMNDAAQALEWVRKAVALHPEDVRWSARYHLEFDNIRHLPRFKELVGE